MKTETHRMNVLAVMAKHRDAHKAMSETDAYSAAEYPRLEAAYAAVAELLAADHEYDQACQYFEIHGRPQDRDRLREAIHRRKAALVGAGVAL